MSLERIGERLGRREGQEPAERPVSLAVGRLGPAWRVLHEVSVGRDQPAISHLAIGPAGVFSLLVRRHPVWRRRLVPERVQVHVADDELLVDGRALPYIPQARLQAWRAARALSAAVGTEIRVRPAVVIAGCEEITFHAVPSRVDVVARRHVPRWLSACAHTGELDVVELYAAARRPNTWTQR